MADFVTILIIGCLLIITYQDFKTRSVSILAFPVLLTLILIYTWKLGDLRIHARYIFANLLIIVIEFSILYILKKRASTDKRGLFESWIGLGDLFFIIALSFLFSPTNFLLFFIVGLVVSFVSFYLLRLCRIAISTIPLAGILSIELIITFIYFRLNSKINPLNDIPFTNLLALN